MFKCKTCGTELKEYLTEFDIGDHFYHAKDELLFSMVSQYKIPFFCTECSSLKFPYKAIRDIVFVWPEVIPEKIGNLFIPRTVESLGTEYGVVISVGEGIYNKKGAFIPSQLKVGDCVVYDKSVPWKMDILGNDGKTHEVKYMGQLDVKGVITSDEHSI